MPLVKRTNREVREHRGRVNTRKLGSLSESDIARFARQDGSKTGGLDETRYIPPRPDVRALRQRLGLSQAKFARRYLLSVRTIQQWEQEKREPSEAARVLLFAIARDPRAVARVLHSR